MAYRVEIEPWGNRPGDVPDVAVLCYCAAHVPACESDRASGIGEWLRRRVRPGSTQIPIEEVKSAKADGRTQELVNLMCRLIQHKSNRHVTPELWRQVLEQAFLEIPIRAVMQS